VNYFIFLVASAIEYFGTFIFMFALFRFRIRKELVLNILLVSFLMSQVSYFTRLNPELEGLSTFIQFALFILVFWILFLIPFFHSIVMNFAGVACVFLVQGLWLFLLLQTTGMPMADLISNVWIASALQVLTSLVQIALARTIILKNWGFDFVPTSPRSHVTIRGTNAILVGIISFAIVLATLLAYIFRNNLDIYVICASVLFVISMPLFIYFAIRKDNEDAA
jgi:hypothetical protein